ncbi:MAG TPA: hypothetical protein VGA36_08850 [Nitriliruptorales bacterium]
MQAAHLIRRSWAATATELDNGVALCAGPGTDNCHHLVDNFPDEMQALIEATIGAARYGELKDRARAMGRVDWVAEREFLKEFYKRVEAA